jgi:hypothetical protein
MTAPSSIELHRRVQRLRAVTWIGALSLLVLPLVAMQFTAEVQWSAVDFLLFAAMLAVAAGAFELFARRTRSTVYLLGGGVTVLGAFLMIWSNLAVGIIGSEGNPANGLFVGVLALLGVGAAAVRLRPAGMARVLVATAAAQLAIGAGALLLRLGAGAAIWPRDVLMATGFFTALWLFAAWLFRLAARTD